MRRVLAVVIAALCVGPSAAAAAEDCAANASVSWGVSPGSLVSDVSIHVDGCEHAQQIRLHVLTDDAQHPADGTLVAGVHEGTASFDLRDLGLPVADVTGIRVALLGPRDVVQAFTIIVDQRFFSPAGNEQVGLRRVTELSVLAGGTYTVPDGGERYRTIDCAEVGVDVSDRRAEGSGTFAPHGDGLHLVCYRQARSGAGAPADPPTVDEEVLDTVVNRSVEDVTNAPPDQRPAVDDEQVLGVLHELPSRPSADAVGQTAASDRLASTGASALLLVTMGGVLGGTGAVIARRFRAR